MVLLIISCKKKDSNENPEIFITSPIENSIFQVLDTIIVSFEVRDDEQVIYVEISLVDENFAIVDETMQVQVNSNQQIINRTYVPSNVDLASGVYYIEIKAFDDEQHKREYVKIILNEYPLLWEGLMVVNENGSVGKINVDYQYSDLWNLPFTYRYGDVDNRNQTIYLGNDNAAKMVALELNSGTLKWEGPVIGSPSTQYFNDVYYDSEKQLILYASKEHEIRKFTSNGVEQASVLLGGEDNIRKVYEYGDHTFAEVSSIFGNQNHLQVYFSQTGNLMNNELFNGDIVEILSFSEDELLILGNDENDQGFLSIYNIALNNFDSYSLFSELATSMTIVDQQRIVVSLENSVYRYDFVTNQLILLELDMGFDLMTYEPMNNVLYCAEGSTIYYYQTAPWTLFGQQSISGNIEAIFNLYNK